MSIRITFTIIYSYLSASILWLDSVTGPPTQVIRLFHILPCFAWETKTPQFSIAPSIVVSFMSALCPGIRDRWRVMVWTTIDSMAVRRRVSWGIETSVTLASEIGLSKTKDHLFCWISHWILTRYLKPGQNQEPMTKQNQLQKNMRFDSIKSFQLKQKTWWL